MATRPGLGAATGAADALKNSQVVGNLEVGKDTSVAGNVSVTKTLTVTDTATFTNAVTALSGVSLSGNLTVGGRVTHNNPCFYGNRESQSNIVAADTIIPFTSLVDVGSCWNGTYFTAPVAGVYEINFTMLCQLPAANAEVACICYVGDGGAVPTTSATTKSPVFYATRAATTANSIFYSPVYGFYVVSLQANQTVAVFSRVVGGAGSYIYGFASNGGFGCLSIKLIG